MIKLLREDMDTKVYEVKGEVEKEKTHVASLALELKILIKESMEATEEATTKNITAKTLAKMTALEQAIEKQNLRIAEVDKLSKQRDLLIEDTIMRQVEELIAANMEKMMDRTAVIDEELQTEKVLNSHREASRDEKDKMKEKKLYATLDGHKGMIEIQNTTISAVNEELYMISQFMQQKFSEHLREINVVKEALHIKTSNTVKHDDLNDIKNRLELLSVKPEEKEAPVSANMRFYLSRRWYDDKEQLSCDLCGGAFGMLKRKHHCRICGHIFCHFCSSKFVAAPGKEGVYRACDGCYVSVRTGEIPIATLEILNPVDKNGRSMTVTEPPGH